MRVVFRIGGSVVASPINTDLMNRYIELIKAIKMQGHEVAVVVGGGSLAREFIGIAKRLELEMSAQDEVAISCSRLFAQLFVKKFGELGCGKVCTTLDEAKQCMNAGKIVVMGGLKPGITTDTVGALVAEYVKADLLVKGSDQDGIFNKDPRRFPDALKLDHLSFDELQSVFSETEHKAGIHQIIDPEAIKVLKRNRIKIIVVNGFKPENILSAIKGEKVGTVVE
jgi:uridylate kinase